ncbi:Bestrophin, RFP-TM, chloride channel-domain-containing protein [Flammula alnicola]|nr:Bestrophin, RFP-TM, chloride channel-domain-containing protein [Flammula alnicola]
MVANNPLFGAWTAKKFSATVLDDIWPEVIFFTLEATLISLVSEKTSVDLGVSNQLLTVLGLVLGLVISFRTSSAYERYQDGRKMWTNIMVASKNLGQMIWIHVPVDRIFPAGTNESMTPLQVAIEKKTMINLVQAFAVSVKHLLRGEQGVYYRDLYPLISFLPRYANETPGDLGPSNEEDNKLPLWHMRDGHDFRLDDPSVEPIVIPEVEPKGHTKEKTEKTMVDPSSASSVKSASAPPRSESGQAVLSARPDIYDPEAVLPHIDSEYKLKPARSPPHVTIYDYFPLLRFFKWIGRGFRRRTAAEREASRKKRKAYSEIVESHIPLEIYLVLSNYSAYLMKYDFVKPAIASGITANLFLMTDTLSNLERICNTPLPFAYQAHLRMSLWIYLLLLPFQIYSSYHIITIPATAFASFLLLGFLEIGQEIENPFNYDLNDLDLDHFCLSIQRDLHEITAYTNHEPSEYLFTKLNKPLAPSDHRHAEELAQMSLYVHSAHNGSVEPGENSIRRTLVTGWKMVDQTTRKNV